MAQLTSALDFCVFSGTEVGADTFTSPARGGTAERLDRRIGQLLLETSRLPPQAQEQFRISDHRFEKILLVLLRRENSYQEAVQEELLIPGQAGYEMVLPMAG